MNVTTVTNPASAGHSICHFVYRKKLRSDYNQMAVCLKRRMDGKWMPPKNDDTTKAGTLGNS